MVTLCVPFILDHPILILIGIIGSCANMSQIKLLNRRVHQHVSQLLAGRLRWGLFVDVLDLGALLCLRKHALSRFVSNEDPVQEPIAVHAHSRVVVHGR